MPVTETFTLHLAEEIIEKLRQEAIVAKMVDRHRSLADQLVLGILERLAKGETEWTPRHRKS